MAASSRDQWAETVLGAVVLIGAGVFLVYALQHAGGSSVKGGYEVTARFGEAGALAPGADVRVAGVKVGSVAKIDLEPKTYLAKTTLMLDPKVELPSDSTAKITSDGLLGGAHISIAPGGATENLKAGGEFQNTQGAVDLFGLIGQVLRPPAGGAQAPAQPAPSTDPYPGG
jgi:phospholipid/cholesterol/gamma-HCH transport system substrate-binding protein